MKLSNLQLSESEGQSAAIEQLVLQLLMMSVQSHVWHWQTKSYACHVALGEFYDAIRDSADAIAEQFMGCGNTVGSTVSCDIVPFSESVVVQKLDELKKAALAVESPIMNDEGNEFHGVADTVIDVIKEIDKLKFLLTLK